MAVTDRVNRPAEPVRPDTSVGPDTPLILVVEDEALLRFAVVDLLEEMGFRVEAAASAREAAIRFASNGGAYRAAIIDLGLPDRSGADLAREFRALRVDVPIVIASGYDETDLDDELALDRRIGFLGKPYGSNGMREVLETLGIPSAPLGIG
jgi:DNA-binding response OmpR family regulator